MNFENGTAKFTSNSGVPVCKARVFRNRKFPRRGTAKPFVPACADPGGRAPQTVEQVFSRGHHFSDASDGSHHFSDASDGSLKQWSKCSPGCNRDRSAKLFLARPGASGLQGARPGDQDGLLTGRTPQGGPLEGATTGEPILAAPTWPPTVVEQVVYRGPALGTKMDFLLVGPPRGGH